VQEASVTTPQILRTFEQAWQVELEWNPFSTASRTARALRDGRIAEAVQLAAAVRGGDTLLSEWMHDGLPDWPYCGTLADVLGELVRLARLATVLGGDERSPQYALANEAAQYAETTAETLWRLGNRIGASAREVDSSAVRESLERDGMSLEQLLKAAEELRRELVDLSLRRSAERSEVQESAQALRNLIEAARAASDWLDQ
jgi:hypothetical protein